MTDLPRAKRSTSSSTQVTDTVCVGFISCSKPHLVGFFVSDELLKFADTDFCVALQQLTQQWCSDHQVSRVVVLNNGCVSSNSLFFLSCTNHSISVGGSSFSKIIIAKSVFSKERLYRKLILFEKTNLTRKFVLHY